MKRILAFFLLSLSLLSIAQEAKTFKYQYKDKGEKRYSMVIDTEGYLPALGRKDEKARMNLVYVTSWENDKEGSNVKLALESVVLERNEQTIIYPLIAAKTQLPDKTLLVSPLGKLTLASKPRVTSDEMRIKQFDFTMVDEWALLPLEFPNKPLKTGDKWTFERVLTRNPRIKNVPILKVNAKYWGDDEKNGDTQAKFTLEFTYESSSFTDKDEQVLPSSDKAVYKVTGVLSAEGTVYFSTKTNQLQSGSYLVVYKEGKTLVDNADKSGLKPVLSQLLSAKINVSALNVEKK